MKLIFSHDSPLDTTLTDSTGRVHYKVRTETTQGQVTTTITRPVEFTRDLPSADTDSIYSDTATITNEFEELAAIDWHPYNGSKLRYDGMEIDTREFMPFEKLGAFSRSGRPMVWGPDGRRYRWSLPTLETTDDPKMPTAIYQCSDAARPQAMLDIMPEGEYMVDLIAISFVYVETLARKLHQTKAKEAIDKAALGGLEHWSRGMAVNLLGSGWIAW